MIWGTVHEIANSPLMLLTLMYQIKIRYDLAKLRAKTQRTLNDN